MNATEKLIETCRLFEKGIKELTSDLLNSRPINGRSSEELVDKRLQDLAFFSAKRTLLKAAAVSSTTELSEETNSAELKQEYEAVASNKVLEQCILKSLTQADIIRKFLQTPNKVLSSDKIAKKEELIKSITDFIVKENLLRAADALLQEKETELVSVQGEWHERLKEMRAMRDMFMEDTNDEVDESNIISNRISRLRMLCWAVQKTATGRSNRYDWLSDPHGRLAAIKDSRKCTIEMFNSL